MDKEHILSLIKWIHQEVLSAGGDGDFLWYSRFYKIEELFPLVEEFNNSLKWKWTLRTNGKTIWLEDNQMGWATTNDESLYLNAPSWQQGLLKY